MEQGWLQNTSFNLAGFQPQQAKSGEGLASAGVNREALLRATAGVLSSSSDESDGPARSRSVSPRHRQEHKTKGKKRKKEKHAHKTKHKRHKADDDFEKVRRIEQRAGVWNQSSSSLLPVRPTAFSAPTNDSAYLDTSGDIKNSMYQSLYAGDIPRYNRLDPLNLVTSRRSLQAQQQQLAENKQTGSLASDRYFRGRHLMQSRSRSMKRIHVADLRPPQQQKHVSSSKLLLLGSAPSAPAAAGAGASSRKLRIPEPEFIPLTAEGAKAQGPESGGFAGRGMEETHGDLLQEVSMCRAVRNQASQLVGGGGVVDGMDSASPPPPPPPPAPTSHLPSPPSTALPPPPPPPILQHLQQEAVQSQRFS